MEGKANIKSRNLQVTRDWRLRGLWWAKAPTMQQLWGEKANTCVCMPLSPPPAAPRTALLCSQPSCLKVFPGPELKSVWPLWSSLCLLMPWRGSPPLSAGQPLTQKAFDPERATTIPTLSDAQFTLLPIQLKQVSSTILHVTLHSHEDNFKAILVQIPKKS